MAQDPIDAHTGESLDRQGPTALMSYIAMASFLATATGVFWIILHHIDVTAVEAGILGGVLTASAQNSQTALSFWTGGNVGAKTAADRLAKLASSPTANAPAAATQIINNAAPDAPADQDLGIPPKPGA